MKKSELIAALAGLPEDGDVFIECSDTPGMFDFRISAFDPNEPQLAGLKIIYGDVADDGISIEIDSELRREVKRRPA